MRYKVLILFFFLIVFNQSDAQNFSRERGLPFVRNYTSEEYKAHEQNFDIVQDKRGIMYFANFAGILEFDGINWHKIPTSSGMRVLSLAINKEGIVYAGGLFDFGYLKQNKKGISYFFSLADTIADKENIGEVFNIHFIDSSTYFLTQKKMYIYESGKVSIVEFKNNALSSFVIHEKLYVFFRKQSNENLFTQSGLTIYSGKKFRKLRDNSSALVVDVSAMIETEDKDEILLGTSSQGLFLLKNETIENYEVPVNILIKSLGLTGAKSLNKSEIVLATLTGGVILSNRKGEILQVIDKDSYLQDESVNAIYSDKLSSLWVATNNGISKVDLDKNITYFDNNTTGLEGKVQDIINFNSRIYIATDNGLFYLKESSFVKIEKINYACWDLLKIGNNLFIASSKGVYLLSDKGLVLTSIKDFTFCLSKSKKNSNTIYSGHNGRICILRFSEGKLTVEKQVSDLKGDVTEIKENNKEELFLEITPGNIIKYSVKTVDIEKISPDGGFVSLNINTKGDEIFFSSEKGLYKYRKNKKGLIKYNIFSNDANSNKLWIMNFFELPTGNYVFTDGEHKNLAIYEKINDVYKYNQTPFLPISDFSIQKIFYDDKTSCLWAGGKDGLMIISYTKLINYESGVKTQIRKITSLNNDSLINIPEDINEIRNIKFSENSLRFDFSVPVFPAKGNAEFRYFLEGFDKDTSDWTNLSYKDYTNIPDGEYVFMVEAKNEFGQLIEKSEFKFKILTPLFRQWWAFIIYAVIAFLVIRSLFNWRMKAAEKERDALEEIVKERTNEIEQSKFEIEAQRDEAEKQKKEILDSINYAKRIQQAVLPSKEYTSEVLDEHFILFLPRDIVSGDFYWIKKIEELVIVVAADCTGHGVPGAFMSMLGSSFLNELVTRRRLISASGVLNRLRKKVKVSLHQEGKSNEQKDGMDIAFFIYDTKTKKLQFSGAYNPLYVIRNNNEDKTPELIQINADRQPIGIHIREKEFTNHVFQLQKGDSVYIFSDGYVDQFGGETGNKYKIKRFKELLLGIQDKSMSEQKRIIDQNFNKWKGDISQLDDVLVIGMKIN